MVLEVLQKKTNFIDFHILEQFLTQSFGFLIPMSSKNKVTRNFFVVTLLAMMFSGAIEVVQILTKVGAFDIDDIILNTAGAIIGYVIFAIAKAIN